MNNIELRFVDFSVTTNNSNDLTVSGYVNEVGKYSHLLGVRKKFKERILPGTFTKALSQGHDIHFLAEHDSNKILASTRNNSLKLTEDERGLFMEATISPTSYGKDYHTLIKDGILRNMSFGFNVLKDSWKKMNDGTYTRDISDLRLFEVSVVTNPAYPQSTISARGLNLVEEVEIPNEVDMEENNLEEKEVIQVEETVEEVVEQVEAVEEVEQVVEPDKEKQEERAYIETIFDGNDFMNVCLNLSAQCLSLAKYFATKNIHTDKIKTFKNMAKTCNDMLLSEVQEPQANLTVAMETVRSEQQEELEKTETEVTNEVEVVETEVKSEEVRSEEEVVEEQPKEEEVEQRDLSSFYAMLDNLKRKGE